MGITLACFGLSYLVALALELCHQALGRGLPRAVSFVFGIAGLVAHTIFLVYHQPNPATASGSLVLLSWVLAIFCLYGSLHHRSRAWALFVLPLLVFLVGLAFVLREESEPIGFWFSAEHFWGSVHGILVLAASVGIAVGFLASLMYLVQARRLRMKRAPLGGLRLLSLERLETMNRRAINLSFPFLTVGLLLGIVRVPVSSASGLEAWTTAKVLGTVGLWLVALVLMYLRYGAHLSARRLAHLTMLAFGLMLLTLITAHPFASGEGAR